MDENKRSAVYDLNGLYRAFIGFLFLIFSYRINDWDIIPDALGYLLLFLALRRIEKYEEHFRKAKITAVAGGLLSLLFLYDPAYSIGEISAWRIAGNILLSGGALALELILCYEMSRGITVIAHACGSEEVADMAQKRWRYFFGTRLFVYAAGYFFAAIPILFLLLTIFGFAVQLMYALSLKTAFQRLDQKKIPASMQDPGK